MPLRFSMLARDGADDIGAIRSFTCGIDPQITIFKERPKAAFKTWFNVHFFMGNTCAISVANGKGLVLPDFT